MQRDQLLDFAAQVESFEDRDQWRVAAALIECAHRDWAITKTDRQAFLDMLAAAEKVGLATAPLAIVLELGNRIVPGFLGRDLLITGPSDSFPSDVLPRWSIKSNGVRLGAARTLTLSMAAMICRLIATERDRSMAAEFSRQRRQSLADITALRARLDRREIGKK
ncbi:MAG: hypothetical protein Q8N31_19905 [Reyranella sp.]|nr:hypothetical protein [Reyranella sp.]